MTVWSLVKWPGISSGIFNGNNWKVTLMLNFDVFFVVSRTYFWTTFELPAIWEALTFVWRLYSVMGWASLSMLRNTKSDIYSSSLCWAITSNCWPLESGGWFNIKMSSYQYRKSHCGDKTVVKSSYLHNGISYTGKMTSLYWFSPQIAQIRYS